MKILYLYAEIMGYTMATIRELNKRYNAEIHIVHWDKKKLTPYQHENIDGIYFYARSENSIDSMKKLAQKIQPDLMVVSGWQDKGYLPVARLLRKKGIPVVMSCDGQWYGTIRQYAASIMSFMFKRYFSHAWIAGPFQFEFVRRLGFKKDEIVFNFYCADIAIFNDVFNSSVEVKRKKYPHRFLYVGRFEKIKGVDLLAEAWNNLGNDKKSWELHCIGNGTLASFLKSQPGIVIHDFMQPDQLKDEIIHAGCFILPSRNEPWGVVIHEFATAGLPIICSTECGAAPVFVIHGLNGFLFKPADVNSISNSMRAIINSEDKQLLYMADYSNKLGLHITPALSAASLISVFNRLE
jgi:glycosyltransferase involved in cell wall biosynthesis